MNGFHNLDGGISSLRNLLGFDSPDLRHVLSTFRIRDGPLSRQLIALLPMLTSSLAVALAGDHHATGALASDVSCGQADIDQPEDVLYALRLMLDPTRMHRETTLTRREPP